MNHFFYALIGTYLLSTVSLAAQTQIYSFETPDQLKAWQINKGRLSLTDKKQKLGKQSLQVEWKSNDASLFVNHPLGMESASRSANGGMNAWIYSEKPIDGDLVFAFLDAHKQSLCQVSFSLRFQGWRCLWSKFVEDMGKLTDAQITSVELRLPQVDKKSRIYLDFVEFTERVSWQKMSDAQYRINQKDYSLIPDFIGYRNAQPMMPASGWISASEQQLRGVEQRLTQWYLGEGLVSTNEWLSIRRKGVEEFIRQGVKAAGKLQPNYLNDGSVIGAPLFGMGAPATVEGQKVMQFRTINEKMLIPLALDYRMNGNKESLHKALYIYDWFNDQGWADGSGLGTLCFEKLRSSGYFHSFFLLKDELTSDKLLREQKAMKWFTLFGTCFKDPGHNGEVADNLRALALPKLIYALSLKGTEREQALTVYKHYMDRSLGVAPGFFGTFKPDFSGYHHRGPYNSAYYPHALYAGALVAYLLHDTPYALSPTSLNNLKQGLLTFRFFCAGLDVPAGTVGRFPTQQRTLETLLPAFAYTALAYPKPDEELIAAYKRILSDDTEGAMKQYIGNVHSNLNYTTTIGEVELMQRLLECPIQAEAHPTGSLFMPYSGLLVMKTENYHWNVKGFSRYIWDFESSASENLQGRYLSYGHLESFDRKRGRKSFQPKESQFNWNFIPGTTSKVLPIGQLMDKGGSDSGHRHFSDETFLAGVTTSQTSLFSFRLHDIAYDASFRANKSVFAFRDVLLCLGSNISNSDTINRTVTTLFQSFEGEVKEQRVGNALLLSESSMLYAVKRGNLCVERGADHYALAYLDHALAPSGERYEYYLLPNADEMLARKLLSPQSPIKVIQQDDDAHLIRYPERGIFAGALFTANKDYVGQPVKRVNIPLAYVWERMESQEFLLSICEPDMRRSSREHMGQLTDGDVLDNSRPFRTCLVLNGEYCLKDEIPMVEISYDRSRNETTLTLTTCDGRNERVELIQNR